MREMIMAKVEIEAFSQRLPLCFEPALHITELCARGIYMGE